MTKSVPFIEVCMRQEIWKNAILKIKILINRVPTLSPEESKSLEGKITLEEAGIALKNMKNAKSPGTDGFGA